MGKAGVWILFTAILSLVISLVLTQQPQEQQQQQQQQQQRRSECYNERPIIGVLTQKCSEKRSVFGDQYFSASYVKWLEAGGARVVPVKINQTVEYYKSLFQNLNGILFPGGGQDLLRSGYANAARFFFRKSMAAFDESGDYFPIWGTCLGFEELLVLALEERILDRIYETKNISLPTKFTPGGTGRLLDSPHGLSRETKDILSNENSTSHFHKWGMRKTTFEKLKNVTSLFKIVSTAFDGRNEEFVDILEGHKYPIYGVQFHPEKNAFEWKRRLSGGIPHTASSIRASQNLANFFVDETRRSCHGFKNSTEEVRQLIYNFKPQEVDATIDDVFQQCYFFNVSQPGDNPPTVALSQLGSPVTAAVVAAAAIPSAAMVKVAPSVATAAAAAKRKSDIVVVASTVLFLFRL